MSIQAISKEDYQQDLHVSQENKQLYGEIFTPFSLINIMFDMMDNSDFSDPSKTFLDAGAGSGYFSMCLFWRLMKGLEPIIPDKNERSQHIIQNMIFMSEIREENIGKLRILFGESCNVIEGNFLEYLSMKFDYIIGNPPYNCNGIKKVPTNSFKNKKQDGKTIWFHFVKHSINLLNPGGKILYIIPSIWMKPGRDKSYEFITSYKLNKVRCMSNSLTNRYFSGEAQTPTSLLLMTKAPTDNTTMLYDQDLDRYIEYPFDPSVFEPIPVYGCSVFRKVKRDLKTDGLKVFKTNMPSTTATISKIKNKEHPYENIRTCILSGLNPKLVVDYSNKELAFAGKRKLIMPHKMYGFPFIDKDGKYGISNRDAYVIESNNIDYLERLSSFFKTKTALYLFEATRYRMKYLEKYVFQVIPDICKLKHFPKEITDDTIATYFGFSDEEKEAINNLHTKKYTFTY